MHVCASQRRRTCATSCSCRYGRSRCAQCQMAFCGQRYLALSRRGLDVTLSENRSPPLMVCRYSTPDSGLIRLTSMYTSVCFMLCVYKRWEASAVSPPMRC